MACQQSQSGFYHGTTEMLNVQHELSALPVRRSVSHVVPILLL